MRASKINVFALLIFETIISQKFEDIFEQVSYNMYQNDSHYGQPLKKI